MGEVKREKRKGKKGERGGNEEILLHVVTWGF